MCVLLASGASGPPAAQADRKPLPLRLVICRSVAPCAPAIAEAAGEFVGHGAGDPTGQAKQQRDFAKRAEQVLRELLVAVHPYFFASTGTISVIISSRLPKRITDSVVSSAVIG